jgi:hypothetical protein
VISLYVNTSDINNNKVKERRKMTTELADDLFPNHETVTADPHPQDSEITKYLTKLDEYTALRHALQKKMSSGFIELARAKYTGRSYGRDFWDEKVRATRMVECGQKMKLVGADAVEAKEKCALKQRKPGKIHEKEEKEEKEKKQYDPINMFGVLVPYSLRLSQAEFQKSLGDMVNLINLQKELDQLADAIEKESFQHTVEVLATEPESESESE